MATMCEAGWDFSSRWLRDDINLKTAEITNIVQSDLNTFLGMGEQYLSTLAARYGDAGRKKYFDECILNRQKYFKAIQKGIYFPDQYLKNPKTTRKPYPTDLFPHLFMKTTLDKNPFNTTLSAPASQIDNGQQWDYPNVWVTNHWVLHEILGNPDDKFKVAQQWVLTTYCSWKKDFAIYEKYDAETIGKRGGGGEYEIQIGFGWSNGLALHYLSLYGKYFNDPVCP
jgi:alpha,alpha-trehalase